MGVKMNSDYRPGTAVCSLLGSARSMSAVQLGADAQPLAILHSHGDRNVSPIEARLTIPGRFILLFAIGLHYI